VRGVTLSTHTDGRDWSQDGTVSAMRDMKDLGAGWVAIHPYAAIRGDGRIRFWPMDPENPPEWIARPIREAHAMGLKILIKPHLAYWGSRFSWRGEIAFATEDEWSRFWADYRTWIVAVAAASREADGFVVGTELDLTLHHEEQWRSIIADVRAVTDVPLTYAANWPAYTQVTFWDDLDVIGIQAYFPLTEHADPAPEEIDAGWERCMAELRDFSTAHDRKILFTELGYNRSLQAPVKPWAYAVDGKEAEGLQQRCLQAALRAVEEEPCVVGAFLWKWFPDPHPVGRNFQLATPELRRVIAEVWLDAKDLN